MGIGWHSVESSNINQVGYDTATQELRVLFNSGSAYAYQNVPDQVFTEFLESPSKGRFLNENIKGRYEYVKL